MSSLGKNKFKRIRQESQDSTTESDIPIQPRKRIRMISSDSGEDSNVMPDTQTNTETDSQGTVAYSLESQRSDATVVYNVDDDEDDDVPLTDDQKKKVDFLRDCFSHKSEKVNIIIFLSQCFLRLISNSPQSQSFSYASM